MSRLRKPNDIKNHIDESEDDEDEEVGGFEYYLTLPSPYAGNSLPSEGIFILLNAFALFIYLLFLFVVVVKYACRSCLFNWD